MCVCVCIFLTLHFSTFYNKRGIGQMRNHEDYRNVEDDLTKVLSGGCVLKQFDKLSYAGCSY